MDKDILSGLSPSKLANHLGLSSQGLFWYERENLITPLREDGKRQYSLRDLYQLSRLKLFRQMGFSLDEADEMLNCTIEEAVVRLDSHVEEMRRKLEIDCAKIKIIENRVELAREFRHREGIFETVAIEPFYFKESFIKQSGAKYIEKTPLNKCWVEDIPFTQYASLSHTFLDPGNIETSMGLMLPITYEPFVSKETREEIKQGDVRLIDPKEGRYGLIEAIGTTDTELGVLFAKHIEQPIEGKTMMKRSILSNRGEGITRAYWEVWFF